MFSLLFALAAVLCFTTGMIVGGRLVATRQGLLEVPASGPSPGRGVPQVQPGWGQAGWGQAGWGAPASPPPAPAPLASEGGRVIPLHSWPAERRVA